MGAAPGRATPSPHRSPQGEGRPVNTHARSRMVDVAREAGVALATVSRALNAPHLVSEKTRARVDAAVQRLGFVPDLTAGALASSRSRIVGALVPTLSNAWFADTMDGLAAALAPAGFQLMISQSLYQPDAELDLLQAFLGRRVDALVFTGSTREKSLRDRLRQLSMPIVETWDLPARPLDMAVGFSHTAVGRSVAQHLRERGRQRVGFVGASEERSRLRRQGLCEGWGVADLPTRWVAPPSSIGAGRQALMALLQTEPGLDAVFFGNDLLAMGGLMACREQDIDVPDRLALIGFSDLPVAQATWPPLSTVRVDTHEIGRTAGELVLQRLAGQAPARRVIDLGATLVVRGSS